MREEWEEETDEWLHKQKEELRRQRNEFRRCLLAKAVDDWMEAVVIRAEVRAGVHTIQEPTSSQHQNTHGITKTAINFRELALEELDDDRVEDLTSDIHTSYETTDDLCQQLDYIQLNHGSPTGRLPWASGHLSEHKPLKDEMPPIPHIQIRFSDQRVRDKLIKLMGTDVVKLSDRDYMKRLQNNRHKLYQKYLDKRIKDRMVWEVERKKNLILEGLVPISEGFQHLTEHPVFRITREVKSVIDERQELITKKEKKKKKVPEFNYRLLEKDLDDLTTPSQVSLISEKDYFIPDVLEANREVVRETLVEEYEAGYMADRKTLEMFVYTPPEVKKLRDSITVDEMYRAAEVVLGTFKESQEDIQEVETNEQEIEAQTA